MTLGYENDSDGQDGGGACQPSNPWKLITDYTVNEYRCGLRAGERITLRRDLKIRDHKGRFTGEIMRHGEPWVVLPGTAEDRGTIYLLQPDGKRHTWNDDDSVFTFFERTEQDPFPPVQRSENSNSGGSEGGEGNVKSDPQGT